MKKINPGLLRTLLGSTIMFDASQEVKLYDAIGVHYGNNTHNSSMIPTHGKRIKLAKINARKKKAKKSRGMI